MGQIVLLFLAEDSAGVPKSINMEQNSQFLSFTWASKSRYNVFPWHYVILTNLVSLQTKSRPAVAEIRCIMVIAKNYKMFFAHEYIQER